MAWLVAIVGSLAGFLFGYDEGIIAGALPSVRAYFKLSSTQEGIMASAVPFGALFGSILIGIFLASKLAKKFGRKTCLMVAAIFFLAGSVGEALAPADWVLICSRFMLGLAIGLSAVITPMFLGEVAPARLRGTMVIIYQLAITMGIVCAYLINYILISGESWRLMFASSAIPAFIMVLGILVLPESPRWLFSTGQHHKATKALHRLRGTQNIDKELEEIESTLNNDHQKNSWRPLFHKPLLPVLLLGTGLFALQQLSGIDVIIYYAPEIFKLLNLPGLNAEVLATLGIGTINMLFTILAMFYIDRIGRRKLLIIGFLGTGISLLALFVTSLYSAPLMGYLSIVFLTLYIISFAISLGPIPYIAMAEIFPLYVKGAGMGLSSFSNWGFNGLMILSFPILINYLGIKWLFLIYSIICFIGLIFTKRYMPETKNLSLEEIETYVMSGKPLNRLGQKEYHHEQ